MRNYGRRLKNLAALCLLLALLSMLLPFFKVEQGGNAQTVEVSGWDVVTSVTKLSVHYLQKGTIEKDYVVKGDLTWQEVCQAYNSANEAAGRRMLIGSLIAIAIPVICCFFAFLLTLVAAKKKGMVLPVLLLIIAIIENLFLIRSFDQILQFAGSFATKGTKVPDITLLVGIFAFTLFCAIALGIILFAWLIRGFEDPEKEESKERQSQGKGRGSHRSKHSKKKRKKRKKSKKESKEQKEEQPEKTGNVCSGQIQGKRGIFQGLSVDLSQGGTFVIGTNQTAMQMAQGVMPEDFKVLNQHSCIVQYDASRQIYRLVSHSKESLVVCHNQQQSILKAQEKLAVPGDTTIYISEDRESGLYLS